MKYTYSSKIRWAVFMVAVFIFASATAFAAESGGIGGKPANPRADNPRSQSIFVFTLKPGESVQDSLEVFNNTETEKSIDIYATDSIVSSGGAFACAQAADPVKNVGGWINLEKQAVTLAPASSEKVAFSVNVPNYAEPGEHNGCIAIQEAGAAPASVGNGIALSFRSAIRVAITVPGEITKELNIRSVTLKEVADKLNGSILLRNSGNVSLDTAIETHLKSLFGKKAQDISGTYPALPQTVTELNFEYKKPYWGGFYKLDVVAKYNSNTKESLGQGLPGQALYESSNYVFVTPAPAALITITVLVVALALAVWFIVQKFIITPRKFNTYADYEITEGDDIQTVAEQHAISWKHLAQVNHLKPPYLLRPGSTIKVPSIKPELNVPIKKHKAKKVSKKTKKEQ